LNSPGGGILDLSITFSPEAQIKVLAKELYKASIDMGRFQSIMNDKMEQLQAMGADEGIINKMQMSMQDQMMGLQMAQMNLEMYMMNVGGANPALSALAQKLSGEAKMLADKSNKEWFDKRAKKIESDVVKAMKQKEAEEAKKQKEKQKEKAMGDKEKDNSSKK
jgi:hypothetical protein